MEIKGMMIEIGNLQDSCGRGMRIEKNGEFVEVIGLTEEECMQVGKWFSRDIVITINAA